MQTAFERLFKDFSLNLGDPRPALQWCFMADGLSGKLKGPQSQLLFLRVFFLNLLQLGF